MLQHGSSKDIIIMASSNILGLGSLCLVLLGLALGGKNNGRNNRCGILSLGFLRLDSRVGLGLNDRLRLSNSRNRLCLLEELSFNHLLILDSFGASCSLRTLTSLDDRLLYFGGHLRGNLRSLINRGCRLDLFKKLGFNQLLLLDSLSVGGSFGGLASLGNRILDRDGNFRIVNASDRLHFLQKLTLDRLLVLDGRSVFVGGIGDGVRSVVKGRDSLLLYRLLGSETSGNDSTSGSGGQSGEASVRSVLRLLGTNTSGAY
ncbi:hypothetical protein HG531_008183 [Fusarium graminearum]|nr:hypothetical protein HG531_008183 [Fusarium graminearum]